MSQYPTISDPFRDLIQRVVEAKADRDGCAEALKQIEAQAALARAEHRRAVQTFDAAASELAVALGISPPDSR